MLRTPTHRSPLRRFAPLLLALLLSLLAGFAFTQSPVRELSDLGPTDGTLQGVLVVGDRVVFQADYTAEKRYDLYSAPVGGGAVVRLNVGLPPGTLEAFQAEDGIVAFTWRLRATAQLILYSVPVTGGTPVQLSLPLPTTPEFNLPGSDQLLFAIDGGRVFFAIEQTRRREYILYSVPFTGGTPVRLSVELEDEFPNIPWSVQAVRTSDDGSRVLYTLKGAGSSRLYSVAGTGGASVLLSSDAAPLVEPDLNGFFLSNDGARAGYLTSGIAENTRRLVSLPAAGGAAVDLAEAERIGFQLSSDNQRVLFTAGTFMGANTLRSRAIDGSSAAVDLAADVTNYITDPAGTHVYYTRSGEVGLFRRPVTGGAEESVAANQFVFLEFLRFSADGQWAIFSGSDADTTQRRLFSYATAGGAPAQAINDPTLTTTGLFEFRIVGQRVVYQAQSDSTAPLGLYSVPLAGGASVQLNAPLAAGEDILQLVAADETRAFYGLGTRPPSANRSLLSALVGVPADGSADPIVIDASRAVVGDVVDFLLAGDQAFYLANQEVAKRGDLYRVPLADGPSVRVGPTGSNDDVRAISLNPAGDRLLYLQSDNQGTSSLWSLSVSGGAPAQIGAAAPNTLAADDLQFAQGGAQVVYRALGDLVRAPTAGGAATVIDSNIDVFVVSPNGAEIIYIKQGFPRQLRRASVAGGEPVLLGSIGGDTIHVAPDSAVIVYQGAGPFGDSTGFVAQPIAGGAATPLPLLEDGETLVDLLFAPDSSAIIYTIDQPNPSFQLNMKVKRAPLNGGAATILDTASSGTRVYLEADPVGARVLALSELRGEGLVNTFQLKAFPFAGGAAATLFGPEELTGSFDRLTVSDEGTHILLATSRDLFSLPAGGGAAAQLNTTPLSGPFDETADGRVLFVAGALYVAPLAGGTAQEVSGPPPDGQINTFGSIGTTVAYIGERDIVDASRTGGIGRIGVRELYAVDLAAPEGFTAGFNLAAEDVTEGEPVTLDISLGAPQSRTVQVAYTVVGGTAEAGVDYTLTPGPLTFAPGETTKRVPLTILERSGAQGARTLILELSGPSLAAAPAQAPVRVTLTITDAGFVLFLPQIAR